MNWKDYTIIALAALLLLASGYMAAVFTTQAGQPSAQDSTSGVTTSETSTVDRTAASPPSAEVNASKPGARAMYQRLADNGFSDARIFIQDNGDIVISYNSDATTGQLLKSELQTIAGIYAKTVDKHPEMGMLTVVSGGVKMHVSKDAALAYGRGDLKPRAFNETLAFESGE